MILKISASPFSRATAGANATPTGGKYSSKMKANRFASGLRQLACQIGMHFGDLPLELLQLLQVYLGLLVVLVLFSLVVQFLLHRLQFLVQLFDFALKQLGILDRLLLLQVDRRRHIGSLLDLSLNSINLGG